MQNPLKTIKKNINIKNSALVFVDGEEIKNKEIVEGKTVKVPFEIIDLGYFDNEPHKPLQIVTMFKEQKELDL